MLVTHVLSRWCISWLQTYLVSFETHRSLVCAQPRHSKGIINTNGSNKRLAAVCTKMALRVVLGRCIKAGIKLCVGYLVYKLAI